MVQQSELLKKDVQTFADILIKTIQGKMQNIITAVEGQTKKSIESLTAKRNEIQQQINVIESSKKKKKKKKKLINSFKEIPTLKLFSLKKHCK